MEPQLNKTSFIPKQSLAQQAPTAPRHSKPRKTFNLATALSLLIFIVASGAGGFVFFYHQLLETEIVDKTRELEEVRDTFDYALVKELQRLDERIESAKLILDNHLAPSQLFELLGATTLKSVSFDKLAFIKQGNLIEMELSGTALNFDAVALQSDVFGSNRFIQQPVISDLKVEEVGDEAAPNDTNVLFRVNARVDPQFVRYKKLISGSVPNASAGFEGGTTQSPPASNQQQTSQPGNESAGGTTPDDSAGVNTNGQSGNAQIN